jgi:hypothetical protein
MGDAHQQTFRSQQPRDGLGPKVPFAWRPAICSPAISVPPWLFRYPLRQTRSSESIAKREGCTARKVNMTISLAFLAPDLVKAAIDGQLLHGMGVARLCDFPSNGRGSVRCWV